MGIQSIIHPVSLGRRMQGPATISSHYIGNLPPVREGLAPSVHLICFLAVHTENLLTLFCIQNIVVSALCPKLGSMDENYMSPSSVICLNEVSLGFLNYMSGHANHL